MPVRVFVPIGTSEPDPLQGVDFAEGGFGFGTMEEEYFKAGLAEVQEFTASNEPPTVLWFDLQRVDEDTLRRGIVRMLGFVHLVGLGVARAEVAWLFEMPPAAPPQVRELHLRLRGDDAFVLPAGQTAEVIRARWRRLTVALEKGPWLTITMEHMLLGLDRAGISAGILDSTISLESLIRDTSEGEIGFKFSHLIARVVDTGASNVAEAQSLLADLYAVRSDHVHGNEVKKKSKSRLDRVETERLEVDRILREAVRYAISYLEAHSDEDWMPHLRGLLLDPDGRQTTDWDAV